MAGWLHVISGVNVDSFLHAVASPIHVSVNTRMTSMAGYELVVCPMHRFDGSEV